MASLHWAIVCERAIVEDKANTVSLISVLENVTLPQPPTGAIPAGQRPFVPLRFYVVQQWARSKSTIGERVAGRILLIGPTGEQFGASEFVVDLTAAPRARVISQAIGFPLLGSGTYACVVQAQVGTKWRKVGRVEFGVAFSDNNAPAVRSSRRH